MKKSYIINKHCLLLIFSEWSNKQNGDNKKKERYGNGLFYKPVKEKIKEYNKQNDNLFCIFFLNRKLLTKFFKKIRLERCL